MKKFLKLFLFCFSVFECSFVQGQRLTLNDKEYFEMPGLNVMVFQDIYPEGHQGGLVIIQNGVRVATNGDLRLEPTPGQWSPIPALKSRIVDKANNEIRVSLTYPDSARNRKGFNPIDYPDLYFNYILKVKSEGPEIIVTVDLDRPLPKEWIGKVGFNFELYPGALFGKSWMLGNQSGVFPRQANGPNVSGQNGEIIPVAYGSGSKLIVAAESDAQRVVIESKTGDLQLFDGRSKHNNGWFVVRSLVSSGATKEAIHWVITPNAISGWIYKPVVHVSQIGYHPKQQKIAVIEIDNNDKKLSQAILYKLSETGNHEKILIETPKSWGEFLRYQYLQFDFSKIENEGMYYIAYGDSKTEPFRISTDVYKRGVWQPVLEYFLPIQMCHMRVSENYKVWHGQCHMDDALMAPIDHNHFDGYAQGNSTLTKYKPQERVPGLNIGGWHDAGDDDLRVESQAGETYILSLAYETFNVQYDNTLIDQENRVTEIHHPDGKPDILQQIQNGALTVVAGYKNLGRLYRGIITPTLHQYVEMGDMSNQTDNLFYNPSLKENEKAGNESGKHDDRWVFTENNPSRELSTSADLAADARVLKGFDDNLAAECLHISEEIWNTAIETNKWSSVSKIHAAVELYITTGKAEYKQYILKNEPVIKENIEWIGWIIGRVLPKINDKAFEDSIRTSVVELAKKFAGQENETPFGVPYKPRIWGAGWEIQDFGVKQYFLHITFPDIIPKEYMLNALNFVLGCHPGENTASFASGVGSRSMTTAYGFNRADWSYIPGGVTSGTALIRPDFPELKDFPFLWQQGEYVLGGGSSNYMFLVLAADKILNK
jgi:hypothetical protein